MNPFPEHSVAGGWLGTYAYGGIASRQHPVRFEATWQSSGDGGRFTGTILDDGPLGEANADGTQSGGLVQFTEVYIRPSRTSKHPVAYEGTLSEDGMQIVGTWRLLTFSGTWDARRLWSASEETDHQQVSEDAEDARERAAMS